MTLIKSISGIRGTIGGKKGTNLTPIDIVECTAGYGKWIKKSAENAKIIIGRDARISGEIVNNLVVSTLRSMGIDVVDLGLSTTPTVEMAVMMEGATGGIILTASHNPKEWNALKLLNGKGEFISAEDGNEIIEIINDAEIEFVAVDKLGTYTVIEDYIDRHCNEVLNLELVDVDAIKARKFKITVDPVNSTGTLAVPALLEKLGCDVKLINGDVSGEFAHNPEPLPAHLRQLSTAVLENRSDLGIAVDPDVDRLALVCDDGEMFGEEYTLVAVSDYVLQHKVGNTVSNLSSSRALSDVTEKRGGKYFASAVGEVNVVNMMKAQNAVIGGEGNGGIIYPELHYGRDALVGIALLLSYLAKYGKPISLLKQTYPSYTIVKNKIPLSADLDVDNLLVKLKEKYSNERINTVDGLKIDFEDNWIHLRKSNTEPILRVYAESTSPRIAENLISKIMNDIKDLQNSVSV